MSDDSTCISYREVIKGTAKAPSCVNGWKGKPNREIFARRDPSWCLDQVIYQISPRNIPAFQDFSPSKVTHERFSSAGESRTYSSLIDTRGFTTAEYVSNCSNWSWVCLFRMLFGIGCNADTNNTFVLASKKEHFYSIIKGRIFCHEYIL